MGPSPKGRAVRGLQACVVVEVIGGCYRSSTAEGNWAISLSEETPWRGKQKRLERKWQLLPGQRLGEPKVTGSRLGPDGARCEHGVSPPVND